ncbi:hypothetical protein MTDSW087_01980 [Methylobacterium dankookense]|uniref:Uncharacterized protein n=1 Tax=Methylobacterium dankookense TaxID=560405 RepID=A0A564FY17_9HYPH|nr:hypothetical protein IFDJLNFL_3843 [Methylobacterium dankookense]VUF12291.1 hypothetical protein MTDSW087_01980 [Methylobacterium dankookense]
MRAIRRVPTLSAPDPATGAPAKAGATPAALAADRAALLTELDLYLAEGDRLIRQAEMLRGAMERAEAPEGHRLLATQVLLALDRLQLGMRRHRAALEAASEPVPAAAGRRPWQGWFGPPARGSI